MLFPNLPGDSKLQIFTSDKQLNDTSSGAFLLRLNTFLNSWEAHGTPLHSEFLLIAGRVLVVAIDESSQNATGCSLDSLSRFLKADLTNIQVDWYNRTTILYTNAPALTGISTTKWLPSTLSKFISDVKSQTISVDTLILDTTLLTLESARENLIKKASKSWLKQMF